MDRLNVQTKEAGGAAYHLIMRHHAGDRKRANVCQTAPNTSAFNVA